jgi:hypothetical protein
VNAQMLRGLYMPAAAPGRSRRSPPALGEWILDAGSGGCNLAYRMHAAITSRNARLLSPFENHTGWEFRTKRCRRSFATRT